MQNSQPPQYSIRDHLVPYQAPVPALINASATQATGIALTSAAKQAHNAGMTDTAKSTICRAYDYLQTALTIVSRASRLTTENISEITDESRADIQSSLQKLQETAQSIGLHQILAQRTDTGPYAPDRSEHAPFHHWLQAHMPAQIIQTVNDRMLHPPSEPFHTLDWETRDGALAAMHRIHQEMAQHVSHHDQKPHPPTGEFLTTKLEEIHQNCIHQMDLTHADIQHEASLHHQTRRQYQIPQDQPQRRIDALNREPFIPGTMRTLIDHSPESQDTTALYMIRHHSIILIMPAEYIPINQVPPAEVQTAFQNLLAHAALDFRHYNTRPQAGTMQFITKVLNIDQRRRPKYSRKRDRDIAKRLQTTFRVLTNPESSPNDVPTDVTTGLQPTYHLTPIAA